MRIIKTLKIVGFTTILLCFILFSGVNGGELFVSWTPNTENDLSGYKIYYGKSSGQYSESVDVGNITSHKISNLNEGVKYYLAVTAYDTAGNESAYSDEVQAFLGTTDNVAPEIIQLIVVGENHLNLVFSEPVERSSAEKKSNYEINNGIIIEAISLAQNGTTVEIQTSEHQPGEYSIVVNNVKDLATIPNVIAANSTILYQVLDVKPPYIINVQPLNETQLVISYSEQVEFASAENTSNYSIIEGVSIIKAELLAGKNRVRLSTTPHEEKNYTLIVNNIKDRAAIPNTILANCSFQYEYIDRTPPEINNVLVITETQLDVTFSEQIEKATAESVTNYNINGGIQIIRADLESDAKTIQLTTTRHIEGTFTIVVNNVRDRAAVPNTIENNSSVQYEYIDKIPPELINVQAITDTQLDLVFSEQIEKTSAENISNYSINNGVEISQAILDNNNKVVHLTTSKHGEGIYSITVGNIKDRAANPNTIKNGTTFEYQLIDTISPEIVRAEAVKENMVDIIFSEPIEKKSAETISNYTINNGISINQAILDDNLKIVQLTTSAHLEGAYVLSVSNVKDRAGNPNLILPASQINYEYIDIISPEIINVLAITDTQLDLVFSEQIEKASAENISNYSINNGVEIFQAILDNNNKVVHLTTSIHGEGLYTITVNNIKDRAANPNTIKNGTKFDYQLNDNISPTMVNAVAVEENKVDITFSEPIEKTSAEALSNYTIDNGISVNQAILDDNLRIVHLTTSQHSEGAYRLSVTGIKDRATTPNIITANITISYDYIDQVPPQVENVQALSDTQVVVQFNEAVDKQSAEDEFNYSINNGVIVYKAVLDENLSTIRLTTSAHVEGSYSLVCSNIIDRAASPNTIVSNTPFLYSFIDVTRPVITSVRAVAEDTIEISFSERVEKQAAENISYYGINGGITILSAILDNDSRTVHLVTTVHIERQYTITVSNVKDLANNPNSILDNSTFNYEYVDNIPPELISLQAITDSQLDIVFSEPVEKSSAEDISNYSINNGVVITQSILNENKKKVHLITSKHGQGVYSILINNIKDRAANPNTIKEGTTLDYQLIDTISPSIVKAEAVEDSKVNVTFSEPIEKISAETISNFSIDNGISISQAFLDDNLRIVHLTTYQHSEGAYRLSVTGIKDRATTPNIIPANSSISYDYIDQVPPQVENVQALFDTQIVVQFSEAVDKQSAEHELNYSINNGVIVYKAVLDEKLSTIRLTTSAHVEGSYSLVCSNIIDRAASPNTIVSNTPFLYSFIDVTRPVITSVRAVAEDTVEITFSEKVEKLAAENLNNYQINNNVEVASAILDENGNVVHLTTTNHQPGNYILILNNIKDRAQNSNVIDPYSYFSYSYVDTNAPLMTGVEILDGNRLKVTFSEKIEKSSAESIENFEIRVYDGSNGNGGEKANPKDQEIKLELNKSKLKDYLTSSTVNILSLNLDSNERIVHIQTTTHELGRYLITANQIKDKAVNPNTITGEQQLEYEFLDIIPPFVTDINIVDKAHFDIVFSESIDLESAENKENYQIDNGIEVLGTQLDTSSTIVRLTSSPHDGGKTYNLTMNNIFDSAVPPNVIAPNSTRQYIFIKQQPDSPDAVVFSSVTIGSEGALLFNWEKSVEDNILGYKIYYGSASRSYDTIIDAGNVQTYSVSGLIEGKTYFFAITVYNIYDRESDFSNEQVAVIQLMDLLPPTITFVSAESDAEIVVIFSENVDKFSSENIDNYNINNGIQIYSATQDTSQRTVRLITSAHSPGEYELVINNIRDQAPIPNVIEPETKLQYHFNIDDFSAPLITELKVLNRNHIDIWFNEFLEKQSSENIENYVINNNILVHQSRLDLNKHVVHLTTSDHISNVNYTLTINSVADCASPANYIEANTKLSYTFVENDTTPPEIYAVRVKSDTLLELLYTEMVQLQQAVNIENYKISTEVQILHASTKNDNKIIQLKTTPHQKKLVYLLSVNGVIDFATPPNKIKNNSTIRYEYRPDDNTAPEILAVETNDETHMDVIFSEMVDRTDAEMEHNYTINNNVTVIDAKMDHLLNVVHLTTTRLTNGESYMLSVSNIRDIALHANAILPNSTVGFSYVLTDKAPPMVNNCYLENDINVIVDFNEIIERESAENAENYKIDNGIEVFHALLDSNLKTVRLITSEHENDKVYTLNLKNIRDRAFPPNTINQSSRTIYSSQTTPEAIVQNLNQSNYQLGYLKVGDEYYVDRNYIITKIPMELNNCLWIKTAYSDAAHSDADFLNFKLSERAMIYVAFDSRALNYPEWLLSDFFRIGKSVNVSDSTKYFDVWAKESDAGMVTLGGNMALGAEKVSSMYVVLIKGKNQNNMMILNGMKDPDSKNPFMDYVLFQNYPNPFNEGTKIKFQLPEDSEVEIKIFNILGQTVTTLIQAHLTAGNHLIQWNGRNTQGYKAPSGIYFARMVVKRKENVDGLVLDRVVYTKVRKMLFVK